MRSMIALAAIAVSLTATGTPRAEAPGTVPPQVPAPLAPSQVKPEGCLKLYHQRDHARLARRVYNHQSRITRKARAKLRRMRECQHSPKASHNASALERRLKRRRHERLSVTPFVGPDGRRWAIPWPVVFRESRGNCRAQNASSTAGGCYQILNTTWWGAGGSHAYDGCSHPAACAPIMEQHRVAARLYDGGRGLYVHWALTAG